MDENDDCYIIYMPDIVFEQMLGYLTYDSISKLRIVSQRFNEVCQRLLNRGFYSAVQFHAKSFKEVKCQLPRRESKRPNHPLARHNNILNAIETRLSLLKMTYCKYIHFNACCFIPGKVVDELFRVLYLVNNTKGNLIPHEVLTELRDISSMAMDYFEEKIVSTLRDPNPSSPPRQPLSPPFSSRVPRHSATSSLNASINATLSSINRFGEPSTSSGTLGPVSGAFFPYADDVLDGEIKSAISNLLPQQAGRTSHMPSTTQLIPVPLETVNTLLQVVKDSKSKKAKLERQLTAMKSKLSEVCRKVQDQERTINEQSRLISEHSSRFTDHHEKINEIMNSSVTAEVLDISDVNDDDVSMSDDNTLVDTQKPVAIRKENSGELEGKSCGTLTPSHLSSPKLVSEISMSIDNISSAQMNQLSVCQRRLLCLRDVERQNLEYLGEQKPHLSSRMKPDRSKTLKRNHLTRSLLLKLNNERRDSRGSRSLPRLDRPNPVTEVHDPHQCPLSSNLVDLASTPSTPGSSSGLAPADCQTSVSSPLLKTPDGRIIFIKQRNSSLSQSTKICGLSAGNEPDTNCNIKFSKLPSLPILSDTSECNRDPTGHSLISGSKLRRMRSAKRLLKDSQSLLSASRQRRLKLGDAQFAELEEAVTRDLQETSDNAPASSNKLSQSGDASPQERLKQYLKILNTEEQAMKKRKHQVIKLIVEETEERNKAASGTADEHSMLNAGIDIRKKIFSPKYVGTDLNLVSEPSSSTEDLNLPSTSTKSRVDGIDASDLPSTFKATVSNATQSSETPYDSDDASDSAKVVTSDEGSDCDSRLPWSGKYFK